MKQMNGGEIMKQCKNAAKYKGMLYPTCDGGEPCEYCQALYDHYHDHGQGKGRKPRLNKMSAQKQAEKFCDAMIKNLRKNVAEQKKRH